MIFWPGAGRRRRDIAALIDRFLYRDTPLACLLGVVGPRRFTCRSIDQLGIDVLGKCGKFRLLAEANRGRPGFDLSATPVGAEQADGDATLFVQFTAVIITDGTEVGNGLRITWLPGGGNAEFFLWAIGDEVALHVKDPNQRVVGLGNFLLWVVRLLDGPFHVRLS